MAGVINGRAYRTKKLGRFGYIHLAGEAFGRQYEQIPAHEFHYFDSEDCGDAFCAQKPLSTRGWKCMHTEYRMLAGFPHLYYYGAPEVAAGFLSACAKNDHFLGHGKSEGGLPDEEKDLREMNLEETISRIKPLDTEAMNGAKRHWDSIAHPLHSLGKLEDVLVDIAGMNGTPDVRLDKKALVVMCADNGIVEGSDPERTGCHGDRDREFPA